MKFLGIYFENFANFEAFGYEPAHDVVVHEDLVQSDHDSSDVNFVQNRDSWERSGSGVPGCYRFAFLFSPTHLYLKTFRMIMEFQEQEHLTKKSQSR